MTGSLLIENLRNIRTLEFKMPDPGVWILTGSNGAGKSSLLACIRRIGQPNAYQTHFPSSKESDYLDNYSGATIKYSINDDVVEYAYRGERWAPRPRENSRLLSRFGYPNVFYIGATADRITPRPEDFKPRSVKPIDPRTRKLMNQIFETDKFDALHTINITTGSANQLFLLKTGERHYHSEKQFSLGELCVLKLVKLIEACPNNSLLLIDELEIALHPRAQVQLLEYLGKMSRDRRLTIIFSTHSVSLLKAAKHSQLIFLQRDEDGDVKPIVGCFPAYAIGQITLGEEIAPDVVFYVEDDLALNILWPLAKLVMQIKYANSTDLFPSLKVVPIGSFNNVVRFLSQHSTLLPPGTKACAFLDKDVKAESVSSWTSSNNYDQLRKFRQLYPLQTTAT